MSPSTDPVAFALGVFGLWCGFSLFAGAAWVVLGKFYAWRGHHRRRVTAPRESAPLAGLEVDLTGVDWRWPPGH